MDKLQLLIFINSCILTFIYLKVQSQFVGLIRFWLLMQFRLNLICCLVCFELGGEIVNLTKFMHFQFFFFTKPKPYNWFGLAWVYIPLSISYWCIFFLEQNISDPKLFVGSLYVPTNILLIAFFNYYYTFLQLDPDDVSEQLKRQGASIPLVRPGKSTATFIKTVIFCFQEICSSALI